MVKPSRRVPVWAKIVLDALLVILLGIAVAPAIGVPHHDFLVYWAAGRLNATGSNPYALDQALAVQRAAGWPYATTPFLFGGPPWLLALMMPFGLLPYALAHGLWLSFTCFATVICAGWLWRYYGGSGRWRRAPILIAITFVPAIGALAEGQVTPLMFLGAVAFLFLVKREAWFWAGVAALALSFKPQLLYLFWPALLFWVIDRRRWRVAAGCLAALAATLGLAAAANRQVLAQFAGAIGYFVGYYPDSLGLGTLMRLLAGPDRLVLRLLPMAVGCAWLIVHWRKHRQTWDWQEQLPLLILASVATTASSWLHDEIVFLIPVIQGLAYLSRSEDVQAARRGLAFYLALDLLAAGYFIPALYQAQVWYTWLPFAFLLWHEWARRGTERPDLGVSAGTAA